MDWLSKTENSEEDNKDTFYEQLLAKIAKAPRHDLRIVIGDMNAKVGSDYFLRNSYGKVWLWFQ